VGDCFGKERLAMTGIGDDCFGKERLAMTGLGGDCFGKERLAMTGPVGDCFGQERLAYDILSKPFDSGTIICVIIIQINPCIIQIDKFSNNNPQLMRKNSDRREEMTQFNPQVDAFIEHAKKWQAEYKKLREIVLSTGLTEEYKWMHPCYSVDGKNVVIIHGFKEYCAILFVKGALLKDPAGILITQTENVQSGRQVRFTELDEIIELEPVLKAYVQEAIEVEKSGLKVELKPRRLMLWRMNSSKRSTRTRP
jgi:hypothetical protein